MNPENIPRSLVDDLDSLCYDCPKGTHTDRCPFKKFAGISEASRRSLFSQLDSRQVAQLFELAGDCACPKDPRSLEQGVNEHEVSPREPSTRPPQSDSPG